MSRRCDSVGGVRLNAVISSPLYCCEVSIDWPGHRFWQRCGRFRLLRRRDRIHAAPPGVRARRMLRFDRQRFECVLRSKMNIAPSRMKGADLQHDQVEWPKPLANELILAREAGIAAEKHGVAFGADDEGGPQSCVAVLQSPTREMLRWRGGHGEPAACRAVRLPPIQLGDEFGNHTPRLKMRADPERSHEGD